MKRPAESLKSLPVALSENEVDALAASRARLGVVLGEGEAAGTLQRLLRAGYADDQLFSDCLQNLQSSGNATLALQALQEFGPRHGSFVADQWQARLSPPAAAAPQKVTSTMAPLPLRKR